MPKKRKRKNGMLDLLANTDDGVFAVDVDRNIVLWNKAAERLLGYTASEVLGKPCHQVIGGRDATGNLVCHAACANIEAAKEQSQIPSHDVRTKTSDGRELWINVTNIPIPSEAEGQFALVHIFRSASATKEMEQFGRRLEALLQEFSEYRANRSMHKRLSPEVIDTLTSREREVLSLLSSGASARAIAETLSISISTARKHIQNILTKLGVHSTLEAAISAGPFLSR